MGDIPEHEQIRKDLATLHSATRALWERAAGNQLDRETATSISEWVISELEGMIQEIRTDIHHSREFHQ